MDSVEFNDSVDVVDFVGCVKFVDSADCVDFADLAHVVGLVNAVASVDFVGFVNFWSRDPWLLILSSGFWFQAHWFLILLLCKRFALGFFGLGPPWLSMCGAESFRSWARFFLLIFLGFRNFWF